MSQKRETMQRPQKVLYSTSCPFRAILSEQPVESICEEFIDPNDQHEKDMVGLLANHL
jgi:hypothetical protein